MFNIEDRDALGMFESYLLYHLDGFLILLIMSVIVVILRVIVFIVTIIECLLIVMLLGMCLISCFILIYDDLWLVILLVKLFHSY